MILVLILLAIAVSLAVYAAFISGMTIGRIHAYRTLVDMNDASYERRLRAETENLAKRNESLTIEAKKQQDSSLAYYEKIVSVNRTFIGKDDKDKIDAAFIAPPQSGKPS